MTRKPTVKPPLIVRLMSEDPQRFSKVLEILKLGGTFGSAASVAGISPSAMRNGWKWANEHTDDKRAKRFLRLTREAIAGARALSEAELRQSDPKFWLVHGPGKLLDNDWSAAPAEDVVEDKNLITQRELVAALVILRNAKISIDELIDSGRIYGAILHNEPIESNNTPNTLSAAPLLTQSNNTPEKLSSPLSAARPVHSPAVPASSTPSGADQQVYMESPHTSSTKEEVSPSENQSSSTEATTPSDESNNFPPKPPYPLVDEVGVGEIFYIDENACKVPADANLHRTGRDIEPSRLLDLHKRKDEEMTPDEIKKKAVADLVRNRKEWLKDAEVEVKKEKTPVKRRKLLPQPPELGKHTKPEEYDMEALEQIEDEMSHLPSSLRKFLGED